MQIEHFIQDLKPLRLNRGRQQWYFHGSTVFHLSGSHRLRYLHYTIIVISLLLYGTALHF